MMSQEKKKILQLGAFEHADKEWNDVKSYAEVVTPKSTNREDFLEELRSGAFDGTNVIFRTFASAEITGRFDEELINLLPDTVKFVCHNGAGYDQIDIEPCTKRGIRVSNVPTAVDDATADVNMFLILGALRGFNRGMTLLRRGEWRKGVPLAHDPEGKVLGILGMGGIGRTLKKRAEAFGMKIQYHNRSRLDPHMEQGARYVSFDELLATSDVISLNLPLNLNTTHIIGKPEFDKMKDGVCIVNTARGAVIDEAALVDALDSGKVRSVGLDVYENEPEIHPGLIANEEVMLVPHMGTHTVETQYAMEMWVMENVIMAVKEGRVKSPVAEQVGMPF